MARKKIRKSQELFELIELIEILFQTVSCSAAAYVTGATQSYASQRDRVRRSTPPARPTAVRKSCLGQRDLHLSEDQSHLIPLGVKSTITRMV